MRLALAMTLAMMTLSPALSYAAEKCTCTHECMENCKKGQGQDCKCKFCDCKKSGSCNEGKCHEEQKNNK